jgi:hypothetical protein
VRAFLPPSLPLMVLTATMTRRVRDEVLKMLLIDKYVVAWAPSVRMDIALYFWKKQDGDLDLLLVKLDALLDKARVLIFTRQEKTMNALWWDCLATISQERWFTEKVDVGKGAMPNWSKMVREARKRCKVIEMQTDFGNDLLERCNRTGVFEVGKSIKRIIDRIGRLKIQQFSSATPVSDSLRASILQDLASCLGKIKLVFATIGELFLNMLFLSCQCMCVFWRSFSCALFAALGVGVNVRSCSYAVIWECLWTMEALSQAIGRVGRGLAESDARPVIDVFYSKKKVPCSKSKVTRSAPAEAVLGLLFGRVADAENPDSSETLPVRCRHLEFAEHFAWEPKYFQGFDSIETFVNSERSRAGIPLHACCDICALKCDCRDPSPIGCSIWRATQSAWGRGVPNS